VAELFTKRLVATPLDRKKLELITRRAFDQKYAQLLGQQVLIFAGPGGTGKTVNLLQLAHFVYREHGKRSLILTYNLSLVADIRRVFALMGMTDDIVTAQVSISSVHAFMYKVLCKLGLFDKGGEHFLEQYSDLKAQLITLLDAVDTTDAPPWDYVFVDEGQDWPADERDILFRLYGPTNLIVADGQTQFVRTTRHCDWTLGGTVKSQRITLSKALRLKHDICIFVSSFFEKLGLAEWQTSPNVSAYGGRVVLVVGPLAMNRKVLEGLVKRGVADGNAPVDLLFCVPPSMVTKNRTSVLAQRLTDWGYKVWDGVDDEQRQSFPRDTDELRVVQYDSCRGLEGWTVVNFAIDELYDYKRGSYVQHDDDQDLFVSSGEAIERFARRWLAIPMTRAIDTLVINVENRKHWILGPLMEAANSSPSVEVVELSEDGEVLTETTSSATQAGVLAS
jgi:hypothetical protein